MIYAIAVTETLQRVVLADKPSLEEAVSCVTQAYKDSRIVLGADDVVADPASGLNAVIEHADWIDVDIWMETEREIIP